MKRIGQMVLAGVGILAMAACASQPKKDRSGTNELSMDGSGIRTASDLSPEEHEKVMKVLHRMLEAMTPPRSAEAWDELVPDGAMTVTVYVYDQRQYDAAVAIVRALRHAAP